MARGLNRVMIIGNIGNDPEVRYMPNGNPVANFSVATTENWKDKQSGERQERTEWHRIVMFNRLAEICGEYLRKGSKVYIEGSLRTRKWQDQSGADKYTTEIVASEMQMLDSRGAGGGMQQSQPMNQGQNNYSMGSQQQAPAQSYAAPEQSNGFQPQSSPVSAPSQQGFAPSQAAAPAPVIDNFDDDIPF